MRCTSPAAKAIQPCPLRLREVRESIRNKGDVVSNDTVWNDADLGNDPETNTVKALRERGDNAVQRQKELEKQLREMRGQLRATQLSAKGVPEKVAQLIPADVADVDAWLEEFKDVFAQTQSGTPDKSDDQPEQQADQVSTEDKDALQDIANSMGGSGAPARTDDVLARLQSDDLTYEELEKLRLSGGRLG